MYLAQTQQWTMERVIRLMAGIFVLLGTTLGALASPYWLILPAMVGANLLVFTFTGFCPMAILLHSLGLPEGKRC